MTYEQFSYVFQPVVTRFGDKVFTRDAVALLYGKLVLLTKPQMEKVVEACLLEFNFAPSLSKIIALAKPEIDAAYEVLKKQKMAEAEKYPCRMCDNSGWVEAVDTHSAMQYGCAFRCTCVIGKDFIGPEDSVYWNEKDLGERFLASYKIKHSQGGGTRNELYEAGERVAYKRLGKIMKVEGEDLEVVKNKFLELSHQERMRVVSDLMAGKYEEI